MGLFDSVASVFTTHDTNQANLKAVEKTNEANAALWREQSAYNTPEQQMKRLETAGLNPNLAYGQIAESRASAPPAMEAPHFERPQFSMDEAIANYQQVKNMQALNAKAVADADVAKSRAVREASDATYTAWENAKLMRSNTLKSDPTLIKSVRRGLDGLGDFFAGVIKRTVSPYNSITGHPFSKDLHKGWELIKHIGADEQAHVPITITPEDGGVPSYESENFQQRR